MTTRSCPWQYEWKRPRWQSPTEEQTQELGVSLCCTSAEVAWDELPPLEEQQSNTGCFFLCVSLFASLQQDAVGDVLLLELIKHESNASSNNNGDDVVERIGSRVLRWPGAALREQDQDDDNDDVSENQSWYSGLFSRKREERKPPENDGLVSICLCRRPPAGDTAATAVDALDVVSLMSLGLAPPTTTTLSLREPVDNKNEKTSEEATTTTDLDSKTTDLILVCLTNGGRVHLYNVAPLFESAAAIEQEDEMVGALASLFLGEDVYHKVLESIQPLSKPVSSVALSVRMSKRRFSRQEQRPSGSSCADSIQSQQDDTKQGAEEDQDDEEGDVDSISWLDGSVWDSTVEPSTAKYRTVDNVPNMCVAAFDYVAVGGRGLCRRKRRRKPKPQPGLNLIQEEQKQEEEPQEQQQQQQQQGAGTPTAADFSLEEKTEEKGDNNDKGDWWNDSGDSPAAQDTPTNWADEDRESSTFQSWDKDVSSLGSTTMRQKKSSMEYTESGGFVTFLSLGHDAEVRTVYLPFAPKKLSPVVWGGMSFLIVLGDEDSTRRNTSPIATAIRVDSSNVLTTPCGEAPSLTLLRKPKSSGSLRDDEIHMNATERGGDGSSVQMCSVRRFQLVPIALPSIEEDNQSSSLVSPIAVSSALTTPPCIAVLYATSSSEEIRNGSVDAVVALYSLQSLDYAAASDTIGRGASKGPILSVQTTHHPGHSARVSFLSEPDISSLWCHIGQGWSLMEVEKKFFFACWEGTTESEGAFVTEIHSTEAHVGETMICYSSILPLDPFASFGVGVKQASQHESLNQSVNLRLPFTSQYDTTLAGNDLAQEPSGDNADNTIVRALESISSLTYSEAGGGEPATPPPRRKRTMRLSHREKSNRLFRHCSSWEQLEDTEQNRLRLGGQVPVLTVRLGSAPGQHFVLSLRKIFIENGEATPFDQVLSWLCQGRDYFTASSIALDLLGDVDALRDLRRIMESIEDIDGRLNLEGLLDGIAPLDLETDSHSQQISKRATSTLTQLADMTVGCLVKGGLMMSTTLEGFLERNESYDPARTSLMLAATTACSVSCDKDVLLSVMGQMYQENVGDSEQITDILWPVRSLLQVATSRDYLSTSLLLLNEAIPDELRSRPRVESLTCSSPPPLLLCTSLVRLIIGSSKDAAKLLLNLIDDQSRTRYWPSLEHETQLKLSLIEINGRYPLLREVEVRIWAQKRVRQCIETQGARDAAETDASVVIPSSFLKELCSACLNNAGCMVEGLPSEASVVVGESDGVQKHLEEFRTTQEALAASPGCGGLDYDLLITALLLLGQRGDPWREDSSVSTQSMLDVACYLSGRKEAEEPVFAFDGRTVTKLCVISGNVSAGANLIGGRDGLVLKCCDVLINGVGMNMSEAEAFLLGKGISRTTAQSRTKKEQEASFALTDGHRHVLWLLDEHVLSVKTYGEFESVHIRGRVDPVFAARSCFRTWLRLDETHSGTPWLVSWLRGRLGIDNDTVSGKRLACAAITRALVWPDGNYDDDDMDEESDHVLATVLGIDGTFLAQIAESCCGLVESIPPSMAQGILKNAATSPDDTNSPVQVDV